MGGASCARVGDRPFPGAGTLVSWPLTRRRHTGRNRQYIGLLAFVHLIHRDKPTESPHRGELDAASAVKVRFLVLGDGVMGDAGQEDPDNRAERPES